MDEFWCQNPGLAIVHELFALRLRSKATMHPVEEESGIGTSAVELPKKKPNKAPMREAGKNYKLLDPKFWRETIQLSSITNSLSPINNPNEIFQ